MAKLPGVLLIVVGLIVTVSSIVVSGLKIFVVMGVPMLLFGIIRLIGEKGNKKKAPEQPLSHAPVKQHHPQQHVHHSQRRSHFKYCSMCGKHIRSDSAFCTHCGSKV